MAAHNKTIPMTEGTIWKRIVAFAIPLFLGNLFQQLYNMADSLIVGNFLGSNALAAVSSSGNLIFLLVRLFQRHRRRSRCRHCPLLWCAGKRAASAFHPHHHCLWSDLRYRALTDRRDPGSEDPDPDGHTGGSTSEFNGLFPGVFCRFHLFCHVQYFCWNPSGSGRFQTSALLSDHFLYHKRDPGSDLCSRLPLRRRVCSPGYHDFTGFECHSLSSPAFEEPGRVPGFHQKDPSGFLHAAADHFQRSSCRRPEFHHCPG